LACGGVQFSVQSPDETGEGAFPLSLLEGFHGR
jgi:hypothetical protein